MALCPFIDKADERCAAHLTLRELSHTFAHCASKYAKCLVYQELHAHEPRYAWAPQRVRLVAAS